MASNKTYEWKTGGVTWGDEHFNAFVISNLTPEEIEENPFSAIVGSQILAENLGLTMRQQNGLRPRGRMHCYKSGACLAQGSERNSVRPPSTELPEHIIQQLEAI